MAFWLMKSEPSGWSWDDQVREGTAEWDGVRNYQAANNLKAMKRGDRAFFYHSVNEKRIAGIVAWGQRGRFVDQAVLLRTLEVVQAIYPGDLAALEAYINARPPPESMRVGETWGSNLLLGPPEPAGLPGVSASSGAQIGATAGRLLEQVRIR